MRVVVTGGTGYVGPAVVEELLAAGHEVVVLEHKHPLDVPDQPRLRRVHGDVTDPASLAPAFAGADAVAHLVAILREKPRAGVTFERMHVEATRNVIDAANAAGIKRFLLMSANGVDLPGADTPYFRTKREMERMVREAGFDWTIFRPSYVAGSREGGFDSRFADIVDHAPILPSFAGGKFRIRPISRRDVGRAFANALTRPQSIGKAYVLVGPEEMTWNDYLHRLADLRGRRRGLVHVPRSAILTLARILGPAFPADADQLKMLMMGNTGDPQPAARDLDLPLERWEDAVAGLRREKPRGRAGRPARG